jgi:hypothetical protein
MAVCQLFGTELYTVMSNVGMLVFIITILLLMAEVDKDIVKTDDIASFLVQVAQKGDRTRMSTFTHPRRDHPSRKEERPMNNDEPCAALSDNETKNVPDVTSNDKDVNEIESMPNADDGNISEVRGDE